MRNCQEDFENVSYVEPVEKKFYFQKFSDIEHQDHDDSNHSKMPKQLCFEYLLKYFNRPSKHFVGQHHFWSCPYIGLSHNLIV